MTHHILLPEFLVIVVSLVIQSIGICKFPPLLLFFLLSFSIFYSERQNSLTSNVLVTIWLDNYLLNSFQGAYTGVCSQAHVPSYKNNIDKLKAKGVDSVICVAVNDPYVLNGWAEKLEAKDAVSNYPLIFILYVITNLAHNLKYNAGI